MRLKRKAGDTEVREHGDYSLLSFVFRGEICWAKVDRDDAERAKEHLWHGFGTGKSFYIRTRINDRPILLHHFILGKPREGMFIDHKSCDGRDNRRQNLRIATGSQNQGNTRISSNNRSGYKGARWDKARSRWVVMIACKWVGSFTDPIVAAKAYDEAAKERFGCFARLNFPDEGALSC